MNIPFFSLVTSMALALAVAGCQDRGTDAAPPAAVSPPAATSAPAVSKPATDLWVGQWNGPEGTFLALAGGGGQYEVTIRNLDGPRSFAGTAAGDRIGFERDGVKESVRATNGAETGMKWLAEKKNCLTVRAGEGYCRD
jgi:predicted small lipoprotein YifL